MVSKTKPIIRSTLNVLGINKEDLFAVLSGELGENDDRLFFSIEMNMMNSYLKFKELVLCTGEVHCVAAKS